MIEILHLRHSVLHDIELTLRKRKVCDEVKEEKEEKGEDLIMNEKKEWGWK